MKLSCSTNHSGRVQGCAAAVNGEIYIFGGQTATVETFSPQTETISELRGAMTYPRSGACCAVYRGQVVIVGGCSWMKALGSVEKFDPVTRLCSPMRVTLLARYNTCCEMVDEVMYVFGGTDGKTNFTTIEMIDFSLDRSTPVVNAVTSEDRIYACAVAVNKRIFIFGGSPPTNTIDVFDTETKTCSKLPSVMTRPRYGACAAVHNGNVYIVGGCDIDGDSACSALASIEKFDPSTQICSAVDNVLPVPRCHGCSAMIDGTMFLFGGSDKGASITAVDAIPCWALPFTKPDGTLEELFLRFRVLRGTNIWPLDALDATKALTVIVRGPALERATLRPELLRSVTISNSSLSNSTTATWPLSAESFVVVKGMDDLQNDLHFDVLNAEGQSLGSALISLSHALQERSREVDIRLNANTTAVEYPTLGSPSPPPMTTGSTRSLTVEFFVLQELPCCVVCGSSNATQHTKTGRLCSTCVDQPFDNKYLHKRFLPPGMNSTSLNIHIVRLIKVNPSISFLPFLVVSEGRSRNVLLKCEPVHRSTSAADIVFNEESALKWAVPSESSVETGITLQVFNEKQTVVGERFLSVQELRACLGRGDAQGLVALDLFAPAQAAGSDGKTVVVGSVQLKVNSPVRLALRILRHKNFENWTVLKVGCRGRQSEHEPSPLLQLSRPDGSAFVSSASMCVLEWNSLSLCRDDIISFTVESAVTKESGAGAEISAEVAMRLCWMPEFELKLVRPTMEVDGFIIVRFYSNSLPKAPEFLFSFGSVQECCPISYVAPLTTHTVSPTPRLSENGGRLSCPYAFSGAVFDGECVWFIPSCADAVVRVSKRSGLVTSYNSWPPGFRKDRLAFFGGVFDGESIWLVPRNADGVVRLFLDGKMKVLSNWPEGFEKGEEAFSGGVFDGENVWLIPSCADRLIKIERASGTMTGYSGWPAGLKKEDYTFSGAAYDGRNLWLVPLQADRVIRVATRNGRMIGYQKWPAGFKPVFGAFSRGVFDGVDKIILVPYNADCVVTINTTDGTMASLEWPHGYQKRESAFSSGIFDGESIWLIPSCAEHVLRINRAGQIHRHAEVAAPCPFAFFGGVYDGESVWMSPSCAESILRFSGETKNAPILRPRPSMLRRVSKSVGVVDLQSQQPQVNETNGRPNAREKTDETQGPPPASF